MAKPAPPAFVYRISTGDEWAEFQRTGATLGGDLDRSTGCIHLSDLSQVAPPFDFLRPTPLPKIPTVRTSAENCSLAGTDLGCSCVLELYDTWDRSSSSGIYGLEQVCVHCTVGLRYVISEF